jgi:hypothetical protein
VNTEATTEVPAVELQTTGGNPLAKDLVVKDPVARAKALANRESIRNGLSLKAVNNAKKIPP